MQSVLVLAAKPRSIEELGINRLGDAGESFNATRRQLLTVRMLLRSDRYLYCVKAELKPNGALADQRLHVFMVPSQRSSIDHAGVYPSNLWGISRRR